LQRRQLAWETAAEVAGVAACAFSKQSRRFQDLAVEREVSNKLLAAWQPEDALGISTCSLPWTGSRGRSWLPSVQRDAGSAVCEQKQCCHHHAP